MEYKGVVGNDEKIGYELLLDSGWVQ